MPAQALDKMRCCWKNPVGSSGSRDLRQARCRCRMPGSASSTISGCSRRDEGAGCLRAPGGKTGHLLELAECELLAVDADGGRARRIAENLSRLKLSAKVVVGDCRKPEDFWEARPFDRILLDALARDRAWFGASRHQWLRRKNRCIQFGRTQSETAGGLVAVLAPMVNCGTPRARVSRGERRTGDNFLLRHPEAEPRPIPSKGRPGECVKRPCSQKSSGLRQSPTTTFAESFSLERFSAIRRARPPSASHCKKLALGKLEQVSGLATWRRAGIQHPHPRREHPEMVLLAEPGILPRHLACRKSGAARPDRVFPSSTASCPSACAGIPAWSRFSRYAFAESRRRFTRKTMGGCRFDSRRTDSQSRG